MSNQRKHHALILLSGGLDSTACLHFYLAKKHDVSALLIDYGQVAFKSELKAVKRISTHFSINYEVIKLKGAREQKAGEIMGRNMMLLSIALFHFKYASGFICLGVHAGTHYSDCSDIFIQDMRHTFNLYSQGKIQIGVPFLEWDKRQIWEYLKRHKIPIQMTYSCELGLKQPCGKCSSCKDLIELYGT